MRIAQVAVLATAFLLSPEAAAASEEVTVTELVEMAADLAGNEVSVEGELVGDYGFRDDGWMWTQLNGDAYVSQPTNSGGPPVGPNTGVGVRMPTELADGLDPPGRYRHRGPVVRLTGIWRYHDPSRQGESYFEVESLVVVEPGRSLHEKPNWTTIIVGILLVGAAAVTWFADKGEM